jgi:multiple sugar transport system permease protein
MANARVAVGRGRVAPWTGLGALATWVARDRVLGWLLVAPMVALVLGLVLYPFLNAFYLSLTDKPVGYPARFVGLENYRFLLRDLAFRRVVWNSLVYTVVAVACKLSLGMVMALALDHPFRGRNVLRGLLLVPWVIPTVVTALTWFLMFDGIKGVINLTLLDLGLVREGIPWLARPGTAMLAVISVNVWRGFPFFGVCLLAGLQAIPRELYDAAAVDGASARQLFRYITLPGLKHVIFITVLLSTIWTLNDFNIIYILTRGGPGLATHVFATYTYEVGFGAFRWGRAVAISLYLVPFIAVIIGLLARRMLREER